MNVFRIVLSDLRFYSKIGVYEQERIVGNEFLLDMEIEIDASGFRKEDLSTTVSYADIYSEISEIMNKEWLLLESVAVEISSLILRRWPFIIRGKVRIDKLSPPINGIDGRCGVEYLF